MTDFSQQMKDLSPASTRAFAAACYSAGNGGDVQTAQFLELLAHADKTEKNETPTRDLRPYRVDPIRVAREELRKLEDEDHINFSDKTEMSPLLMAKRIVDAITANYDIIKKETP